MATGDPRCVNGEIFASILLMRTDIGIAVQSLLNDALIDDTLDEGYVSDLRLTWA
jgi:hypothetical protein